MPIQPGSTPKTDPDDNRRRELKRLVETYALRTRELSEAAAVLGAQIHSEKKFQETMMEIRRLRVLIEQAGAELVSFVESTEYRAFGASTGEGQSERPPK